MLWIRRLRTRRALMAAFAGVAVLGVACVPKPEAAPPPPPPTSDAVVAITPLTCPLDGFTYGDGFGPRGTGFHSGVDLLAPAGTPVVATRNGTVHFVADEGAGGHTAYVTGGGYTYHYAHLLDFAGVDRTVTAGELLGHVGQTGNATTPHLHFGLRIGTAAGTRIDPRPTLDANNCT
jgi:murein DD-endopeptidase MepM/ murein hydrolase activator NlpD